MGSDSDWPFGPREEDSGRAVPLPHLNARGEVHMVNVSGKPVTVRRARAEGVIHTRPEVVDAVRRGALPKGDVLAVARVAAVMAAKRTADWVPLAHPVPLAGVAVDIVPETDGFRVTAEVWTEAQTGVEMEALTAVTAGLLTLYDMMKKADRAMTLGPIRLLDKTGGQSGDFRRDAAEEDRSP
jgi:cyclic pyranopterin phosphate synthase